MNAHSHSVVVGGTGMLRGVCLWLAGQGHAVSVVARRRDRLDELARAAAFEPGPIHGIALDYTDDGALRAALAASVRERGPAALAVCWIHSTAPRALQAVAESLIGGGEGRGEGQGRGHVRLLHLQGSAADDPSLSRPEIAAQLRALPGVRLEVVLLGFVRDGDRTRWLTDEEIAEGVIESIRTPGEVHEVGTLRPWSERP